MESVNGTAVWNTVAEVELSYKTKVKPSERPKVNSSKDACDILLKSWDESKIEFIEQFKILLLNTGGKVLGIMDVSTGGVTGTVADPKVIFIAALRANAAAIILSHNHPSGNLQPSGQDMALTHKINEGGKLLDIAVRDHIIITTEGYYSFADEGLL